MMIVDDDDKSKKEILKDSLLFFHISSLLRFPLVYERSLMASLNIDVDDFTYTPLLINGTADSPSPNRSFRDAGCLFLTIKSNFNRNVCFVLSIGCLGY